MLYTARKQLLVLSHYVALAYFIGVHILLRLLEGEEWSKVMMFALANIIEQVNCSAEFQLQ